MRSIIFRFIVFSVFIFYLFSCIKNESQDLMTERLQYSVIGKWFFKEDDGSPYIFTFTDKECIILFLGDDKAKTAKYEIEGEKIITITEDGIRHEWDYEFQDEDTLKINIEIDQRYFFGKRVKNNVTSLDGLYRLVNGVGYIYSFDFIDSSNVKIEWGSIHGDPIIDDSKYEINGTSVIFPPGGVLGRDLEIVGDSILLINITPYGIIGIFEKE